MITVFDFTGIVKHADDRSKTYKTTLRRIVKHADDRSKTYKTTLRRKGKWWETKGGRRFYKNGVWKHGGTWLLIPSSIRKIK